MKIQFETVDVFTQKRFGGNPLAVFLDATDLTCQTMQAIAAEMNFSETKFTLPPDDAVNTARVRIFNRKHEMPFAGHPLIGTAYVLSRKGLVDSEQMRFEVTAGIVDVSVQRSATGQIIGGSIVAPLPFETGQTVDPEVIAQCLQIDAADIVTAAHRPVLASVGNPYVIVELRRDALARCVPDVTSFRAASDRWPALSGRFSVHVYARDGSRTFARMFAPLAGTHEDPATGSANAPLGGLLLSLTESEQIEFDVEQGVEMGRPSLLRVRAWRSTRGILTSVAGHCVPVLQGTIDLDERG